MRQSFARAALSCIVLFSGVANAYCGIDRGVWAAGADTYYAFTGTSPRDDSCVASDTLSTLQVSENPSPGEVAAQAAQVLTFRGRHLGFEPTPYLKSLNHPALRREPVFQRVPRLLI